MCAIEVREKPRSENTSIAAEAIKCRYCGSRVDGPTGDSRSVTEWHRDWPDRKIAGVCSAVAHHMGVSVTAVRAAFLDD